MLVALLLAVRAAEADPAATSEARRLTEESIATYKRAEAQQQGSTQIYDEGIALAKRALALDPTLADAHYAIFLNLGGRSQRAGVASKFSNLSELKAELAKTLELDPKHAHGWEARGEMLLKLPRMLGGSTSDGEAALRRSRELAPDWPKPPLRLAELHASRGEVAEAESEAKRALELAEKAGDDNLAKEASEVLDKLAKQTR